MRKTVLAAAALAAVLSLGAAADRAQAMTGATPTELGLSTTSSGLVQNAALVCGRWGCRRAWGPRVWVAPRGRMIEKLQLLSSTRNRWQGSANAL